MQLIEYVIVGLIAFAVAVILGLWLTGAPLTMVENDLSQIIGNLFNAIGSHLSSWSGG